MGVNLKLLVVDGDGETWGHAHTMLALDRNTKMWQRIEAAQPEPRPGFVLHSYVSTCPDGKKEGERCYGAVTETSYGELLTYLRADKLAEVLRPGPSYHPRTVAAVAYLDALPPETKVALYWC